MSRRTVFFYDLIIAARGNSRAKDNEADFAAVPKSLNEILSDVHSLHLAGDNFLQKGYSAQADSFYLADMVVSSDRVVLLVNRSDPSAPDAVSSNPDLKTRVVHNKPDGHGGEYSAHIILYVNPVRGDNHYLCVFESAYGSGLSATSIKSYLAHIVRHCKKQKPTSYKVVNISGATDKKGQRLQVGLYHEIDFRGHPSKQFQRDLSGGRLSSIELVSFSEVGATWDDRGFVTEKKRSVILEPKADLIGDVLTTLKGIRNKITTQHKEYAQIRVKFKTEQGDAKDAVLSSDTGELYAADSYVRKQTISASTVNYNSFDKVQVGVVACIDKLLKEEPCY
ncbi:hypothetical protein [Pseudomonas koreensis]|jgi:hypothetical protein|uniref:hypothetical protein n=1 Tax=Pseudomonas koreensis TaxID=198620 RepID=UPI0010C029B8|nr:hypothetical protein [Pseudomonas koreensis]